MKQTIHFTKMQGAGNDYIYVNASQYPIADLAGAARAWSDRNKGIGSDGLVIIEKADDAVADFSMRIFNSDGSEADMCGNASRCIGKYIYERGLSEKRCIRLLTRSGIKNLWIDVDDADKVRGVTVDMLEPRFVCREQFEGVPCQENEIEACGHKFKGTFVSMGNPHFVIFVTDMDTLDICKYGSALESNPVFPRRCNIEFAQIVSPECIRVRVWERGSGITKACGSGACATAVAAGITSRAGREVTISMDGGDLNVNWNPPAGHVYLSGPAEFVFDGEIEYGSC